MTNKAKKVRRDVQDRTGWTFQFCHYLVSELGYEVVSKAIDDTPDTREAREELGRVLNKRANDASKEKPDMNRVPAKSYSERAFNGWPEKKS